MSQNKALFQACSLGDAGLKTVQMLKKKGIDLSSCDAYQNNALHYACQSSKANLKLLQYLIKMGVSVHHTNNEDNTPLHFLCYILPENIKAMYLLLNAGIQVNAINQYGMTALHVLYDGRLRLMGRHPNLNKNSMEFYRYARRHPFFKAVELLFSFQADPNISNCFGDTPCHTVSHKNLNIGIVKNLLLHNANLNIANQDGLTPLHIQCAQKTLDRPLIEYMISHGADLYYPDRVQITPLHRLCMAKKPVLDAIKTFIALQECYENSNQKDKNKSLHRSVEFLSLFDSCCIKKENKIWINAKSTSESLWACDLKHAAREKEALSLLLKQHTLNYSTIKFLIQRKVNLDVPNIRGNTLLHRLCIARDLDLDALRLMLVTCRVDPNCRNQRGDTPFHVLMKKHPANEAACRLFLKNAANPNVQNQANVTPLHILCGQQYPALDVLGLLLKYHADPYLKTMRGVSSMDLISNQDNSLITLLLIAAHGVACEDMSLLDSEQSKYFNTLMSLIRYFGGIDQYINELIKNNSELRQTQRGFFSRYVDKPSQRFIMLLSTDQEDLKKMASSVSFL